MKKARFNFFLIAFFVVFFIAQFSIALAISVEQPQLGPFNVTISIAGLPSLIIIKPKNETYFSNNSLILEVTSNADNLWFNIDNGNNISFFKNESPFFNAPEGAHIINIFANNTHGIKKTNVTFNIDLNKFRVIYDEYKGAFKGQSTNFDEFSFGEIQSLSNVILENTLYGKIEFNQAINITNDANIADNVTNLDLHTNISFNRIELDSNVLPNFNVASTLTLYNLTFTNPRILKDGIECSSGVCTRVSYSSGNLVFNVNQFSIYSAAETPQEEAPGEAPGEEREETIPIISGRFFVDKGIISVSIKQGETKTEQFTIENLGLEELRIKINSTLEDFLKISKNEFVLAPKEKVVILLELATSETTLPDLYTGKIVVESQREKKEILVLIEVESKEPLFDVKAKILEDYLKIYPGEELLVEISLFNLQRVGLVDVLLNYEIRDFDGKKILESSETVAVETQTNFLRKFVLPEDVEAGSYVFYVSAIYDGQKGSSSDNFKIRKRSLALFIFLILIIIFSIMAFILFILYNKSKKFRKKIELLKSFNLR